MKAAIVCYKSNVSLLSNKMYFLTTDLSTAITWRPAIEQHNPSYEQLAALSDFNQETCLSLDSHFSVESRVLFVGSFSETYKNLHVSIHTRGPSLHFHDDTCTDKTLVLMTHAGPKTGFTCRHFCGVPTTCNLKEKPDINAASVTFQFNCMCPVAGCSELLLWLWVEPDVAMPSICEIIEISA